MRDYNLVRRKKKTRFVNSRLRCVMFLPKEKKRKKRNNERQKNKEFPSHEYL